MNKKIQSFFSKFKFKWWSWELDVVKLVPAILIMLAFLPVLPYEKKEGKLHSVIGFEASVDNFYEIGSMKFLGSVNGKGTKKSLKGEAFHELAKHSEKPIPNPIKHKDYLINEGVTADLAQCISLRDFILYNYFWDNEMRILINQYPPSPVPVIWLARITIKYIVDLLATTSNRFENFNKLIEKCSKFENISPPSGYLEDDFSYERK